LKAAAQLNEGKIMNTKKIVLMGLILVISIATYQYFQTTKHEPYSTSQATQLLDAIYKDISGFSIDQSERKFIEEQGGNPTYGEITFQSTQDLINHLELGKDDVFFDLGCGIGKVCCQVALTTPARAIGIELSPTRCALAQKTKQCLINQKAYANNAKLEFYEQNILDANLEPATVIFACSTCFSDQLMQTLTQKFETLPKLKRVVTLKELAPTSHFTLAKTFNLPMTWSDNTPVHVYAKKNT
jgi:SAM-dependent methyltransferase